MGHTQKVLHVVGWHRIGDPHRDERAALRNGDLHLAGHLRRAIGGITEQDQDRLARFNRADDASAPLRARCDIAWGDPAAYPMALKRPADLLRRRLVLRRIAQEYAMAHGAPKRPVPRAV